MKKLMFYLGMALFAVACSGDIASDGGSSETLSGSYANMLVVGDFLYAVSDDQLISYDRTIVPDQLVEIGRVDLDFGVESLLVRSNILFIGSTSGMYIYEIGADGIPFRNSFTPYTFEFDITPCDPIAVNDTLAVVSLSTQETGPCNQTFDVNQLRFYDITDLEQPALLSTWTADKPKGIVIDGSYLFVCEADLGLFVYDISQIDTPDLIYSYTGIRTFDLIATGSLLVVVGPDAIFEFDYTDINNIKYLSQIDF